MPTRGHVHFSGCAIVALTVAVLAVASAYGGDAMPAQSAATPNDPLARVRQKMAEKKPVHIVCYGDSISEVGRSPRWCGGAKTPDAHWGARLVALLAAEYPDAQFILHHFGIGGQNAYEGLGRLDGLAAFTPDLVFVEFGTNDVGYHFLLPEETGLAISTLVADIRARHHADVVVMGTAGDNPLRAKFRHLDETIAATRKAAEERKVPFVDMRSAVLEATGHGERWAEFHLGADNCHPNDAGHALWARTVFDVLRPLLAPASSHAK